MKLEQYRVDATSFSERSDAEAAAAQVERGNVNLATEVREYRNEGFFVRVDYIPTGDFHGWIKATEA